MQTSGGPEVAQNVPLGQKGSGSLAGQCVVFGGNAGDEGGGGGNGGHGGGKAPGYVGGEAAVASRRKKSIHQRAEA